MSMMGELTFFLGLQIKQSKDGIFINQAKYTKELLKRFDMEASNAFDTPMSSSLKLDKDEKGKDVDIKRYRVGRHDGECEESAKFDKVTGEEIFEYGHWMRAQAEVGNRRGNHNVEKYDDAPELIKIVGNNSPAGELIRTGKGKDKHDQNPLKLVALEIRRSESRDFLKVFDKTSGNSLGDVIQFLYGEDGMDVVWIESQKLDALKMKKVEFNKVFSYELDDEKWNPNYMLPEHVEDLKTIREFRNVFDVEVQKLDADRFQLGTEIATTSDNSWHMPVNLKRLIWNAQKTFKVDLRRPSDMHSMEIVEATDKLHERLKVSLVMMRWAWKLRRMPPFFSTFFFAARLQVRGC
ncbi:hypothetical protein RJ640_013140 [Escallonia rubra]|uniref:RNA polymerase Rpb1 domain-containing protein n=1 Tax=Escallonia rubra TaxID=112253 RepID=A0AA88R213_9ASTE|nr:hypothetical protein RJ640_013140 [Escallonia rubra]